MAKNSQNCKTRLIRHRKTHSFKPLGIFLEFFLVLLFRKVQEFRVVRACHLSLNLEIMEALYIKALAPNLCVQKSTIAHLQLFRHR